MSKIFIYGAPGSGKTTVSRFLKLAYNFPIVEADYLREVIAQLEKTEEEDPFLYVGTKQAWRTFGELTKENVQKGLFAVRNSMESYVSNEINLYNNLIMEAVFLIPQQMKRSGTTVLLVTPNEERHKKQFFQDREQTKTMLENFQAIRLLQEYLIEEAKRENIQIIENNDDIRELVKKITR